MDTTRRARLAAAIQEELATFVYREVKDPRIPPVTFTRSEVTQDGAQATVWVAILGGAQRANEGAPPLSEKDAALRMKECIAGLNSASGFMRRHLARLLTVRHIPSLIFKEDRGFENTTRVHELLMQITHSRSSGSGSQSGTSSGA